MIQAGHCSAAASQEKGPSGPFFYWVNQRQHLHQSNRPRPTYKNEPEAAAVSFPMHISGATAVASSGSARTAQVASCGCRRDHGKRYLWPCSRGRRGPGLSRRERRTWRRSQSPRQRLQHDECTDREATLVPTRCHRRSCLLRPGLHGQLHASTVCRQATRTAQHMEPASTTNRSREYTDFLLSAASASGGYAILPRGICSSRDFSEGAPRAAPAVFYLPSATSQS